MEIKNPSKPQDAAILGIDGKGTWASGSGIRVSVATKHEAEVIPVAETLAAYLYKAHGDAISTPLGPRRCPGYRMGSRHQLSNLMGGATSPRGRCR
jgi:hypothetical protein